MKNENTKKITITKTIEITQDNLCNVMAIALEGGIGYWAILDNTSENWKTWQEKYKKDHPEDEDVFCSDVAAYILWNGGYVEFEDAEGEGEDDLNHEKGVEGDPWKLTLDRVFDGLAKEMSHAGYDDVEYYLGDYADADSGDLIIQWALFGEIVFG